MKLLLVGNHTCGNRGDAAILRGLLAELRVQESDAEIDILSRYPVSSSYLLGEKVVRDELHVYHQKTYGRLDQIWKRYSRRILARWMNRCRLNDSKKTLPKHILKQIEDNKKYDAVIQVGGSFFVDLYGESQFEHSLCAMLASKPIYMVGHSVGPFQIEGYNRLAGSVFKATKALYLREDVSLKLMQDANFSLENVREGSDTAWLVPPKKVAYPSEIKSFISKGRTVAITLRKLAPFDKRLGVSQEEYELAFSRIVNSLNDQGYQVIALSTCTGIDSYHNDDRMIAYSVGQNVTDSNAYHIAMDELNDVQLGSVLSDCVLTVGTRLHSAIISKNYGTPAIALNYEHKSLGIMQQLGLEDYAFEVKALFSDALGEHITHVLDNIEVEKARVSTAVEAERCRGKQMIAEIIEDIKQVS
ncbi:colanic acid biosynthesis pyruvyl transferase WcaK [Corallincola holothuriorum]|uniref:Colanic acid biosynthesis pyruvyl transferase WcaK n=1 Tax=Corallincola holothuriorum TaxID=2282215 RepID=A0A368NH62_9GAMM|nr:colanic acid biosynthesis pyruvyl transferase WcaK [Corallincola holothuriorum]RCU49460.1 colanic acid biosynthesis pyruvyl transferase WcaK [Corallincola holothuriorum]